MLPRIKINSLFILLSYTFAIVYTTDYEPCDFLKILVEEHDLSLQDALGFTCVGQELSELKTTNAFSGDGGEQNLGIFGITVGKVCEYQRPGICGRTCDKFLDNDITDDLHCIKTILKRTGRRPESFTNCEAQMWKNVKKDCEAVVEQLKDVALEQDDTFFNLADYKIGTKHRVSKPKTTLKPPKSRKVKKPKKPVELNIESRNEKIVSNGSTFVLKSDQNEDTNIRITVDLTRPQPPSSTKPKTPKPFTQNRKTPISQNIQEGASGNPKPYYIELYHHLTQTTLVLRYELYPPYEEESLMQIMKGDLEKMKIRGWDLRGPFEDKNSERKTEAASDDFRLRQVQVKN